MARPITLCYIKTNLTTKLDRVIDSKIMDEYKLKVYTDNLLPSEGFSLTVHDIIQSGFNTLDQTVEQYLKQWCGLPERQCH